MERKLWARLPVKVGHQQKCEVEFGEVQPLLGITTACRSEEPLSGYFVKEQSGFLWICIRTSCYSV